MISLEGRIARIEAVLALIFKKLPGFIKDSIDKEVHISIERMEKDANESVRLKRDEH